MIRIILLLVFLSTDLAGQTRMYIEDLLLEGMKKTGDTLVLVENTEVRMRSENIYEYLIENHRDEITLNDSSRIVLDKHLTFQNCYFFKDDIDYENTFSFDRIRFEKSLKFINCQYSEPNNYYPENFFLPQLKFEECFISNIYIEAKEQREGLRSIDLFRNYIGEFDLQSSTVDQMVFRTNTVSEKALLSSTAFEILDVSWNTFEAITAYKPKTYLRDSSLTNVLYGRTGNYWFNRLLISSGDPSFGRQIKNFICEYNDFKYDSLDNSRADIEYLVIANATIRYNNFGSNLCFFNTSFTDRLEFYENDVHKKVAFTQTIFSELYNLIPWDQIKGNKLAIYEELNAYDNPLKFFYPNLIPYYGESSAELRNKLAFDQLIASYRSLYHSYRDRGDIESANDCYIEMQDLISSRWKVIYQDEGRLNWFRWKLSQLLKLYTEHGTEPAKALVISFYILLVFAIIYFFFPSEWDKTSKSAILINLRSAISRHEKGTFKSILKAITAMLVSFLNAFTLSINSFVTLGFGTIPTTGFARYVCIVQGFIGWFLLSIFTVALINQVLF